MKSVFLDQLHEICQSYARTHLNLRDEEELKPQKKTETKSEGENPLQINQKLNKKMNHYKEHDGPWDKIHSKDSNYSFSQFKQDCEQGLDEEPSEPSEEILEPKKLQLPSPDASAGERECGALWVQKGSDGKRFNGEITIEGSRYKVSVLPNLNHKRPNCPTHRIFWH